ncbi:MAG: hypothetical protein ABW022_03035 [Actinoplanes sp.]
MKVDDDEFYAQLADTIDQADAATRARLTTDELDRRRTAIMKPPVRRRMFSLAAAVVLLAFLSIGLLLADGRILPFGPPPPSPTADGGQQDPLPQNGLGGPELAGQRYSATDPRTGVHLDVGLEKKVWGTQISFAIAGLDGPRTAQLVVVRVDGTREPVASWAVGEKGWGTAANPEPLILQAITATSREDIAHIRVQEVTPTGTEEALVSVP